MIQLMKSRNLIGITVLGLALLLSSPALADVSGKWEGEVDTQLGRVKYRYDLQPKGTELAGKVTRITADSPGGTTKDIVEGKTNGDEVSFVEILEIQGQRIRVEYKGKVSGDEMKLTRNVGEFGRQEFTAKRVKPSGPPTAPAPK
jgi:hypothetical protein